jgi:PAS domain S-box-containing protein
MRRKAAKESVFEMNQERENAVFEEQRVWYKTLSTSFDFCSEALILMDYHGNVRLSNPMASELFGYEESELRTLKLENLFKSINDLTLKVHLSDLINLSNRDIQGIRKDGYVFPLNIRMHNLSASRSVYALLFISVPNSRYIRDKAFRRLNSEIGRLKGENNRLKNQAERIIRDRTKILQESVYALVQTQKQLQNSLNKEIETNEKCSKYAFLISHEYRNPLAAILSSLDIVERYGRMENNLNENQYEHLRKARDYVKQLTVVTEELLQLNTKVNNGQKLSVSEVDVSHLLVEISKNWARMTSEEKTVPIRLNMSGRIVVETNIDLLKQALNNLISNALKYSDGNGEVEICCDEDDDTCVISVKDKGRGIPREELHKLSNGLYRATNSKGIAGNGLGLIIVRQFLEHLNGKLELMSELNLGTCATIRLPKKYEEKSIVN